MDLHRLRKRDLHRLRRDCPQITQIYTDLHRFTQIIIKVTDGE